MTSTSTAQIDRPSTARVGVAGRQWGWTVLIGVLFVTLFWPFTHPVVGGALTVLWVVGLTNAFNLIDGIDGLAAGIAVIAGSTCAAILVGRGHVAEAMLLCALIGTPPIVPATPPTSKCGTTDRTKLVVSFTGSRNSVGPRFSTWRRGLPLISCSFRQGAAMIPRVRRGAR